MKWLLLAALGVGVLNACVGPTQQPKASGSVRRVVSLVPSLTEDLFAIGAGAQVVGRSLADEYPPQVKRLPAVSTFSSVDTERIVQLHPNLVVGIPAQQKATAPLRTAGVATVLMADDSFADLFADIAKLAALTGHSNEAQRLQERLRLRTRALQSAAHFRRPPSVLVVINVQPIIVAGAASYISHLVKLAGARNAAQGILQSYPTLSAEAILKMQPDAIVSDKQTNLRSVLQASPWRDLRAVAQNHIFIIDPADTLERPGPRYNEGLSWLIARLKTMAS
ncbi:MAG: hypothetical protein DLM50_06905 [Candidatus Meridianibacter frigidus]|nr:MAG: hypothetical protein DLM50_06905 [Candidatus Eremiobacteraeota bacterium]